MSLVEFLYRYCLSSNHRLLSHRTNDPCVDRRSYIPFCSRHMYFLVCMQNIWHQHGSCILFDNHQLLLDQYLEVYTQNHHNDLGANIDIVLEIKRVGRCSWDRYMFYAIGYVINVCLKCTYVAWMPFPYYMFNTITVLTSTVKIASFSIISRTRLSM